MLLPRAIPLLARLGPLVIVLVAFACAGAPASAPEECGPGSWCSCANGAAGTCAPGGFCVCSSGFTNEGSADAGVDSADASLPDAGPAYPGDFVGRWSPLSGTGEEQCSDGRSTSLPPNTGAIFTVVQTSPNTLTASSSGVPGCNLDLLVTGTTASLLKTQPYQTDPTCSDPTGALYSFDTFNLTFVPAGADAGSPTVDEGGAADAGDGGDSSLEDGGTPPDASVLGQDSLVWQLGEYFSLTATTSCRTSLTYTLVRAN